MKFVVKGKLPSRNEEIQANRTHWSAGAKIKTYAQSVVCWSIKSAISSGDLKTVTEPIEVFIEWHGSKRKDVDNIQSSTKYILDALQETGILPSDSQKWVKQVWQKVVPDREDYVVVEMSERGWSLTKRADEIEIPQRLSTHESLISREEMIAEIGAEMRFAELKEDLDASAAYSKAIAIVEKAKIYGSVNPTQFIFYGSDRE